MKTEEIRKRDFVLYPKTDYIEWAKRYGISLSERPCPKCKKNFALSTPVALKGYRGLQSLEHDCGPKYVFGIFVPVEREEIQFWLDVKYGT